MRRVLSSTHVNDIMHLRNEDVFMWLLRIQRRIFERIDNYEKLETRDKRGRVTFSTLCHLFVGQFCDLRWICDITIVGLSRVRITTQMSGNLAKISILIVGSLRCLDGTSFQVTLSSGKQIVQVSSCSVNKLSTLAKAGKLAVVCGKHTLLVKYICTRYPELSPSLSLVRSSRLLTSTIYFCPALGERFLRMLSQIMTFVRWSTARRGTASIHNSLYASGNKRSIAAGIFFITTVRGMYIVDGRTAGILIYSLL